MNGGGSSIYSTSIWRSGIRNVGLAQSHATQRQLKAWKVIVWRDSYTWTPNDNDDVMSGIYASFLSLVKLLVLADRLSPSQYYMLQYTES